MTYRILSFALTVSLLAMFAAIAFLTIDRRLTVAEVTSTADRKDNAFWIPYLERNFEVDLIEAGEGFHGDQIMARNGEEWLGLFESDGRFFLKRSKLAVTLVRDVVLDSENERTGKTVRAVLAGNIVFLLKPSRYLPEGDVTSMTWLDEMAVGNVAGGYRDFELFNGSERTYELGGRRYKLSVVNPNATDRFLTVGSGLIYTDGETEQVLELLPNGCNDCGWMIHWIGDLDRDGKPDLYLDLTNHYNVSDKRLYLSGKAEPGRLVKWVAEFWTNGC